MEKRGDISVTSTPRLGRPVPADRGDKAAADSTPEARLDAEDPARRLADAARAAIRRDA